MSGPVLIGRPDVRLAEVPAVAWCAGAGEALPWSGYALLPSADGAWAAVADGNRSAILVDPRVTWRGSDWLVSIKGIGGRTAPYVDAGELGRDGAGRLWASECWLGEAPFGGQGEAPAGRALALTASAVDGTLGGMPICPVVAVAERTPPDDAPWWYRRYRGRWMQEHRLVPSNVRLRAAGAPSVAEDADALLGAFGLDDARALDGFLDRLLGTGLAAATLFARTLRDGRGLVFDDVWLDKDAVVASDGALCFADLEGIVDAAIDHDVATRVVDQLDRTLYEVLSGADALLRAGERRFGPVRTREARRRGLGERLALALDGDPFVRAEPSRDRVDVVVRPGGDHPEVRVTVVDLEASCSAVTSS